MNALLNRLADSAPLILDGATGTELARRGGDVSLPLWSAGALLEAPDLLRQAHADYVEAGAELLTANTFRTHARSLAAGGLAHRAAELTRRAVEIARAAAGSRAWVAGSQAPLEDCYAPRLVPGQAVLDREHAWMARHLAEAGVDAILVETQNTIREAHAAARAASATGRPVFVSFVCRPDGRLLSGEGVREAVEAVVGFRPAALLINCTAAEDLWRPLAELRAAAPEVPSGAYGNVGRLEASGAWRQTGAVDPDVYARHAARWIGMGARLVGGCCGTTPEHIRRLLPAEGLGGRPGRD